MSDDEDDYLYGPDEPDTKRQKENNPPVEPIAQDRDSDQDNEEGSEEEDSDSDIEFVINTAPGEKVSAPTATAAYSGTKEETKPDGESSAVTESNKEGESTTERLDINAVGEHDGKPITQVNLEDFAEKPWRQPGADITDYFNYGFDEFTWSAYCSKQDNLREDYSGQKVMNRMMGGMPGMPMPGMPPMDMSMMFPMGNMNQNSGNKSNNGQMDMSSMMGMMGMMPGFMPPGNNMNQMPQQQQQNDAYGGANIQAYGGNNNQGGYKNQQQMRR